MAEGHRDGDGSAAERRPSGADATVDGTPSDGEQRGGDQQPGDRSGKAAFVAALEVKRNAMWGLVAGVAFAVAVFVFFVVVPGSYRSTAWYVALGFVLALSTAGFVAFLLTLVRAYRLSQEL